MFASLAPARPHLEDSYVRAERRKRPVQLKPYFVIRRVCEYRVRLWLNADFEGNFQLRITLKPSPVLLLPDHTMVHNNFTTIAMTSQTIISGHFRLTTPPCLSVLQEIITKTTCQSVTRAHSLKPVRKMYQQ